MFKNLFKKLFKKEVDMSWRLEFPEVTDVDMAFGGYPKDFFQKVFSMESQSEDKQYNELMETLFFKGGDIPLNKGLPEEYLAKGLRILKAIMGSWTPKHEHKEKVCGLILKSLCKKD